MNGYYENKKPMRSGSAIKNWNVFIVLFLCLICPTIKAQIDPGLDSGPYQFLLFNQPSRYDSSVNIHLSTYRAIRQKSNYAARLIDSLRQEQRSTARLMDLSDSLFIVSQAQIYRLNQAGARKDSMIMMLQQNYFAADRIANQCLDDKRSWVKDPKTWGISGVILGIIIKSLL